MDINKAVHEFYETLDSLFLYQEEIMYDEIKRKLRLNKNGKPIVALFNDILKSENLCLAKAVAQFLFIEPVAYTLLAYLNYKKEDYHNYLETLDELSSLTVVEDEWIYKEIADIFSNLDAEDVSKKLQKLLNKLKKKKLYRYRFPLWSISEIIKRVNNMLVEEGFSQESISSINESSMVCLGLGSSARHAFFEGRDSLDENAFAVYISSVSYIAIRSGLPLEDRRKALARVVSFIKNKNIDIEESPLLAVLEKDGHLADRTFWDMCKETFDTAELAILMVHSKIENPLVKIPVKGFEEVLLLIREASLPILCNKCESSTDIDTELRYKLVAPKEKMWFVAPFFLAVKDEEKVYPSFRTLDIKLKEEIIVYTLESFFEEDKELLKPILKRLLEFSNKKLREELREEVDMI